MALEYIDTAGKEHRVESAADLAAALRDGRIHLDTLVRSDTNAHWQRAVDNPDCIAVSMAGSPMVPGEELRNSPRLQRVGWLLWLLGILIVVIGGIAAGFDEFAIGGMLGTATLAAILVAIAAFINSRSLRAKPKAVRIKESARAGLVFAAACAAILGHQVFQKFDDQSEFRKIVATAEGVKSAQERQMRSGGNGTLGELSVQPVEPTDSDARKARFVIDSMMSLALKHQQAFAEAVDAADYGTLLSRKVLSTSSGRQEARRRLHALAAALDSFEAGIGGVWSGVPGILDQASLSPRQRLYFLDAINESLPESQRLTESYIRTQREIFAVVGQVVEFFDGLTYTPAVQNGLWVFQTTSDRNRYQELTIALQRQLDTAESIQQELSSQESIAMSNLRDLAGGDR